MEAQVIFFLVVGWVATSFILMIFVMDGQMEAHDAAFWPIALLKWLLRQLYLVLFTGWKQ